METVSLIPPSPFPASSTTISSFNLPVEFKNVLETLPESNLKLALHAHLPFLFRDGMFEHNAAALEAVYRTNPPLATKLLFAAKFEDLFKRQNLNNTTTTTIPSQHTTVTVPTTTAILTATTPLPPPHTTTQNQAPTTASNTPVIIPISISTTDSAGQPTHTIVSVIAPSASTSLLATFATTTIHNNTPLPTVITTSVPAEITTNPAGKTILVTAPTVTAAAATTTTRAGTNDDSGAETSLVTTTNGQGFTYVSTTIIQPASGAGVVSRLLLVTTTLPNGARSTYTSFTVVPASSGAAVAGSPELQGEAGPKLYEAPRKIRLISVLALGLLFSAMLMGM